MLRKDRTVIEPKCQFGIECNYLKGEVDGSGGPPCRYFHPKEHYDKLRNGRSSSSSSSSSSFDPLRSVSKVKSFTAAVPSHRPVSVAPKKSSSTSSASSFSSLSSSSSFSGFSSSSPFLVVELLTASSVRSGPRFADSALLPLPPRTLCCGRTTRTTDGNVRWLELLRPGAWLPLVNTSSLALLQRPRLLRLLSATVQNPPSFPLGEAGPTLAAGLTVHVVATLELPDRSKTLGCLAVSNCWIDIGDCDEVEWEQVIMAVRLVQNVAPHSVPSLQKQWALPVRLAEGTLLTALMRVRITEEGRATVLLHTSAGWVPEALCSFLMLERRLRKFVALQPVPLWQNPSSDEGSSLGEIAAGEQFVVAAVLERNVRLGFVESRGGWAVLRGVEEGTVAAEEDIGGDEEGLCSVCMARQIDCGLLHADSMHRCVCTHCAKTLSVW